MHAGRHQAMPDTVAVKVVDAVRFRNIRDVDQMRNELAVMQALRHPHIIDLLDVAFHANRFYIVLECAKGGDLKGHIRAQVRAPLCAAWQAPARAGPSPGPTATRSSADGARALAGGGPPERGGGAAHLPAVCFGARVLPAPARVPPRPQAGEHPAGRQQELQDRGLRPRVGRRPGHAAAGVLRHPRLLRPGALLQQLRAGLRGLPGGCVERGRRAIRMPHRLPAVLERCGHPYA